MTQDLSAPTAAALASALERFATVLEASTDSSRELAAAVKESERARRRSTLTMIAATVVSLILIAFVAVTGVATLQTSRSARTTQLALQDCLDPAGTCAKASAARTAGVLRSLAQAQLTISTVVHGCVRDDAEHLEACVQAGMDQWKAGTLKGIPTVP